MIWHVQPHVLVQTHYLAQRWTALQGMGPSPSARGHHVMASDGTRVFVLGGTFPADTQAYEEEPVHVLNTSMYLFCVISFG